MTEAIDHLGRVKQLLDVSPEHRDERWPAAFLGAVPRAGFRVGEPQVILGPDGFNYFVLNEPAVDEPFQPVTLMDVLDHTTDQGLGCVLNPGSHSRLWVSSFGDLWWLRSSGKLQERTEARGERVGLYTLVADQPRQVLVASPSESYFPRYGRDAVREFLKACGIAEPKVLLLTDPSQDPIQSLVFSLPRRQLNKPEAFEKIVPMLSWFLPPHYPVNVVGEDSQLQKSMRPF